MTRVPSSTMHEFAKFCAAALIASTVTATALAAVLGNRVWWWAVCNTVILCGFEARRLLRSKNSGGSSSENSREKGAAQP